MVSKLVLWVPRMVFNSDGLYFVQNNHTKTQWVYLEKWCKYLRIVSKERQHPALHQEKKQPKHCLSSTNSKIIESRTQPAYS